MLSKRGGCRRPRSSSARSSRNLRPSATRHGRATHSTGGSWSSGSAMRRRLTTGFSWPTARIDATRGASTTASTALCSRRGARPAACRASRARGSEQRGEAQSSRARRDEHGRAHAGRRLRSPIAQVNVRCRAGGQEPDDHGHVPGDELTTSRRDETRVARLGRRARQTRDLVRVVDTFEAEICPTGEASHGQPTKNVRERRRAVRRPVRKRWLRRQGSKRDRQRPALFTFPDQNLLP